MKALDEQVVIVTGAGRGIGLGIAESFAKKGAQVIIATKCKSEGQQVEADFLAQGWKGYFIETDVASEASIMRMVDLVVEKFGRVDTLVNNAGITIFKAIEEVTLEEWDRLIQIDLRGPFLCTKYVLPYMKKQEAGSIINISSNHALATLPHAEIYAAAKGGVNAMTRSMAISLGKDGIRVNAICPGFTDTPHYRQWLSEESGNVSHQTIENLHATQKICSPQDIGSLAVYLASSESAMITGENILMDGGLSIQLYQGL